jgi:DNA-binding IclR family transcriptional regulator
VEQAEPIDHPRWPSRDPERFVALRAALVAAPGRPADLSRRFQRAPTAKVGEMLQTLAALGQAHRDADGRYRA